MSTLKKMSPGHYRFNSADIYAVKSPIGRWLVEVPGGLVGTNGTYHAKTLKDAELIARTNTARTDLEPWEINRMIAALNIAVGHVRAAAEADREFSRINRENGAHGSAAENLKMQQMRLAALDLIANTLDRVQNV
jgi:hypothetical protein